MWTRVKSTDESANKRITVFDIEKDLNTDKSLQQVRRNATSFTGSILFDPDEWRGKSFYLKMQDH